MNNEKTKYNVTLCYYLFIYTELFIEQFNLLFLYKDVIVIARLFDTGYLVTDSKLT